MKPERTFNIGIRDVNFGPGVTVADCVNLYGCTIGEACFIGPFVEVQKGVVIGKNTKVQSHSFICELVSIGDNCFIGHGVMFINDLFSDGKPADGDKAKWKSTTIGNNVSIGSNATILPVSICDGAVIGAGAVVTKNIDLPGIYAGNPARLIKSL
ncbi:acyltransferase [Xiashengella succiniciproducens]|uniref:N-acetyltransferase n=1 Tax=Xiashengella succiniciproducens TaxID=2949635 RepID=A0A9J6ZQ28_9BACT|nr:acyltransferase [Alkaliflexus sp. Ai-910]URW79781.1 N-acetyltransferase [Alkaliflexus sp. Ai-910]